MKSTFIFVINFLLLMFSSCNQQSNEHTLRVAASSIPHAEILEFIADDLKKEGFDLQIIVVEDYNTPNRALADKEVDANFFQHPAFLNLQINDFQYPLEILGPVHLEPMGIYSHKFSNLAAIAFQAKIAIPSDPSNQARALQLLEEQGLIKLSHQEAQTSILNITENTHQLKFIEIDSPLLARSLDDVDFAAITTNFALQAQLKPTQDALAIEDASSPFVNVIVIRQGEADQPKLQALLKALQSDRVKRFIEGHYKGAVIPAF